MRDKIRILVKASAMHEHCITARCRWKSHKLHSSRGTGAPEGNQNRWRHGRYAKITQDEQKEVRSALASLRNLLGEGGS
jgi:hypothetical protein